MTSRAGAALNMNRTLNASVETVFRALTSRDSIARWFGPSDEFAIDVHEWDCREGGRYRVGMRSPDGENHVAVGEFVSIVPNEKVAYTWTWEGQPPLDTLVTLNVKPAGDRTELSFKHEGFPADEVRDQHQQGWTGSLSRLAKEVEG